MNEPSTRLGTQPVSRGARIEVETQHAEAVVFSAYGELDLHVTPELQERFDTAIEGGAGQIVLDLSAVTFIDSMALGVLLGTVNRLRRRGGALRIVVPSPELRRIFEISLLDRIFTLDWTREEALQPAPAALP